ncbi:MAG TPA: LytTR family DNA-binding domain-containing protein [Chloroflexia bacterium]|nr:LytTR family DNA-binding domain-containing protein [Chloroflexia bacterium]
MTEGNEGTQLKPRFKTLVLDDERPALEELAFMLGQSGYCSRIVTSDNVLEALRFLQQEKYDLVFADVQMPGLNGLEFVQVLQKFAAPPRVIFVTAYEDYAVKAFNLDAVDYLLKPVAQERLEQALERVARRERPHPSQSEGDNNRPKKDEEKDSVARDRDKESSRLDKLPVDKESRTLLIDLSDIRYAVARGDYVYIKTFDQEYLTRFSITDLEKRLPSPPFLRTHRAFLVNLRNVNEIQPFFNGAYVLKVNDKEHSEVQVSRGHARSLRALLGM